LGWIDPASASFFSGGYPPEKKTKQS